MYAILFRKKLPSTESWSPGDEEKRKLRKSTVKDFRKTRHKQQSKISSRVNEKYQPFGKQLPLTVAFPCQSICY